MPAFLFSSEQFDNKYS